MITPKFVEVQKEGFTPKSSVDYIDGVSFSATIMGRHITGKITIEEGIIYFCQNVIVGSSCRNKRGYIYSYQLEVGSVSNIKLYYEGSREDMIKKMEQEIIENNKKYAARIKTVGNEYLPICYEDFVEGDLVLFSQIGSSRTYTGYLKSLKGELAIYLDEHGHYITLQKNCELKYYVDQGLHFYHGDFDFGYRNFEDVKVNNIVFDIDSMSYQRVLKLTRKDGIKTYSLSIGNRTEKGLSLKRMSPEEVSAYYKQLIEESTDFKYLTKVQEFSFDERLFIETGDCFFDLGNIVRDGFRAEHTVFKTRAKDFVQTRSDIKIYLPIEYLNYFGYSEQLLIEYIELLNTMFGEQIYVYKNISPHPKFIPGGIDSILSEDNRMKYRLINNNFYVVFIKGCQFPMQTFLRFTLLSYIASHIYKNTPHLFLKVSKKMGEQIGLWKCLLLSNSLTYFSNRFGPLCDFKENEIIDLEENDYCSMLKILRGGNIKPHNLFEYCDTKPVEDVRVYREMIKEEQYEQAIKFINFDILN